MSPEWCHVFFDKCALQAILKEFLDQGRGTGYPFEGVVPRLVASDCTPGHLSWHPSGETDILQAVHVENGRVLVSRRSRKDISAANGRVLALRRSQKGISTANGRVLAPRRSQKDISAANGRVLVSRRSQKDISAANGRVFALRRSQKRGFRGERERFCLAALLKSPESDPTANKKTGKTFAVPPNGDVCYQDEFMAHRRLNPSAATSKAEAAPGYLGPGTSSALLLRRPRFEPPAWPNTGFSPRWPRFGSPTWPNTDFRGSAPGIVDTTGMFSRKRCASWQKNGTGVWNRGHDGYVFAENMCVVAKERGRRQGGVLAFVVSPEWCHVFFEEYALEAILRAFLD